MRGAEEEWREGTFVISVLLVEEIPFFHIVKFLSNLPDEGLTNHHSSSLQTIKEYNKYKIMIASYAHLLN